MSYAVSAALQAAMFTALTNDAALNGLVGAAIYDAVPSGALPPLYVSLGPERARDESDVSGFGADHRLTISVVTEVPGFSAAKEVAGAVCDVLHDADLTLSRGRLVSLRFQTARALKIDNATGRRIDLIFRARIEDS
jgi:hypothetical protein